MGYSKLKKEDRIAIFNRIQMGEPRKKIAQEYNVHTTTLSYIYRKYTVVEDPDKAKMRKFVNYLRRMEKIIESLNVLADSINDKEFISNCLRASLMKHRA